MTEHWSNFWTTERQSAKPNESFVLASTTDSQESLDQAAGADWRGQDDTDGVTYTSVGESIVGPDGSLEHGDATVRTPGRQPKEQSMPGPFEQLSAAQRGANLATYQLQAKLARQSYPDFDRVVNDDSVQIPQSAIDVITQGGLPNAAGVSYYLGQHRQECDHLCKLAKDPRRVEE